MIFWLTLLACREEESDPPSAVTFEDCYPHLATEFESIYGVTSFHVGSHCNGTDHQNISGIERVVFLGDSVTIGTFPTDDADFYRSRLALSLAAQFGLDVPEEEWFKVDYGTGETQTRESGAFASCARLGARMDDLMRDGSQVEDCLPPAFHDRRTLIVMTMGGNDLQSLTEGFIEERDVESLWEQSRQIVRDLEDAVSWMKDAARFPNGSSLVFSNIYEFTDGTGDTTSCGLAEMAGLSEPVTDPALEEMVLWVNSEMMRVATEQDADMLFLLERFCGHGFHHDDPESRCYLGPDAGLWFDNTCVHPNPAGHGQIAGMFMDLVLE
jgi:lysophospholipase L1-like esterase